MGVYSFKEDREDRLRFYGKRVYGIKAYINFWVPFIAVISVWGVIQYITDWESQTVVYGTSYTIQVLIAALALLAFVTGRFFNKYTFYVNIVFLVFFIASRIYNLIITLVVTKMLVNAVSESVQEISPEYSSSIMNAVGSIMSTGLSVVGQISLIAEFISLGLALIFFAFYFYLLIKNRKLFLLSYQDLRDNYDDFIG